MPSLAWWLTTSNPIQRVTADKRFHTPDLGGKARTTEVTAAVIDSIRGAND